MKVAPIAIVRALISRLTAEERTALAHELLEGAAAAPRASVPTRLQPVPVKEFSHDACSEDRVPAV